MSSLVALAGCNPQATPEATTVSPQSQNAPVVTPTPPSNTLESPVSPAVGSVLDNQLVSQIAQDNLFELQANQLAAQKASKQQVQQFGQQMVQDHQQATQYLEQIAANRNMTLPTQTDPKQDATLNRLASLSGAEFDRAYINDLVDSYRTDVALLKNQAQLGNDAELRTKAAKYLPALQERLQTAESLYQQLQGNG